MSPNDNQIHLDEFKRLTSNENEEVGDDTDEDNDFRLNTNINDDDYDYEDDQKSIDSESSEDGPFQLVRL